MLLRALRRGQERRRTAALCSPSPVSARRAEFRAPERLGTGIPPCREEHIAVRQQGRRVSQAGVDEVAASGHPSPGRRVVEFCAGENAAISCSSRDEHLAIGQQRRRVGVACGDEAAGGRPGPAR